MAVWVKNTDSTWQSGAATLAMSASVTSAGGSTLVISLRVFSYSWSSGHAIPTITSISDGTSNVWHFSAAAPAQNPPTGGCYDGTHSAIAAIAYCINAAPVNGTVTVNIATASGTDTEGEFTLSEFSGMSAGTAVDAAASSSANVAGNPVAYSTPAVNTINASDLVVAVCAADTGQAWASVSSPFSLDAGSANHATAYGVTTSPQTSLAAAYAQSSGMGDVLGSAVIAIGSGVPSLQVSTTTLPQATPGTAYSAILHATGGTPPYTWSVSSGALPAWASLGSPDVQPVGISGAWRLDFSDDFNGTALDTSKWLAMEGATNNNVTSHAANVSISGGNLVLTLASSSSGAQVISNPQNGGAPNGYTLPVGSCCEARCFFPGSGQTIYNWPAWWTSGANWPAAGEIDIAEGLAQLSTNYHGTTNSANGPKPAGNWGGTWHVYSALRLASSIQVYWDGVLVWTQATGDNGGPQSLIATAGAGNTAQIPSQVLVDYVRAWSPSTGGNVIAGTPAAGDAGSTTFTVQVADSAGHTATRPLTLTVAAVSAWTQATLQNSWTNYGGSTCVAQFRTLTAVNEVRIVGTLAPGTKADDTVLFTLPAGSRPNKQVCISCATQGMTAIANDAFIAVNTDGTCAVYGVNQSGLSFIAFDGTVPLDTLS